MAAEWFFKISGQVQGPISVADLQAVSLSGSWYDRYFKFFRAIVPRDRPIVINKRNW
jgi:hypothetical protein